MSRVPSAAESRRAEIREGLAAARERSGHTVLIGEVELYCDHQGCVARTVTMVVKEYEGATPAALYCPACRRQLKPHGVRTMSEVNDIFDRDARTSVNIQIYKERQRRLGREILGVPGSVICDTRLPGLE